MRGPGSQLTVDNAGKRWCMIVWQWPFESFPRLVIRQGWLLQPSRVTPAQDLKFQRRFYLCHSTRSVNTPSVNPGPAYPPFFGPKGPGPEGLARPVRVCARARAQHPAALDTPPAVATESGHPHTPRTAPGGSSASCPRIPDRQTSAGPSAPTTPPASGLPALLCHITTELFRVSLGQQAWR